MINNPIIVGCGTIGATLALYLAKQKLVSQLQIYDFDTVSLKKDQSIYPFHVTEHGLFKVDVIKFLCQKENPDLQILASREKVLKPFDSNNFIIDCRDCKRPKINSDVRLSLDGFLLYIDSFKRHSDNKNYYKYVYPRNSEYIDAAIKIITEYLVNDKYIHRDLRLYNIKKSEEYILKQENNSGMSSG